MKWTVLVKVDGGNAFFNRAGWEMLAAQIRATDRPVVQVVRVGEREHVAA